MVSFRLLRDGLCGLDSSLTSSGSAVLAKNEEPNRLGGAEGHRGYPLSARTGLASILSAWDPEAHAEPPGQSWLERRDGTTRTGKVPSIPKRYQATRCLASTARSSGRWRSTTPSIGYLPARRFAPGGSRRRRAFSSP